MSAPGISPSTVISAGGEENRLDLIGPLGGDEPERDDEYRQRQHRSQHGPARSVVGSGHRQTG